LRDYPIPGGSPGSFSRHLRLKRDYHPSTTRSTGALDRLGRCDRDMGAHLSTTPCGLNLAFLQALDVSTLSTRPYPSATLTFYEFPLGSPAAVKLTWYDAASSPTARRLGEEELKQEGGACSSAQGQAPPRPYGFKPRSAKSLHDSSASLAEAPRMPRSPRMNGSTPPRKGGSSCPFEYAARLTEVMLLGVVALRAGRRSTTTAPDMRITNVLQANDICARLRQGWSI